MQKILFNNPESEMNNDQNIIETRNLNKYYNDPVNFQALRNVNLTIKRGEFTSIMGASGSGKSTLLYVLSTLDTNYSGQIFFDNDLLNLLNKNQLSEIRNEKIGFVFQFHYLLPEFTVLENVSLPALKLGLYTEEEIYEKANEKLKLLGLGDQALKKANKLSGGQQQRAAIARALINHPKIIFGDEPTGNLDSKNSQLVYEIFRELNDNFKQTIVVVTHDVNFANQTDRIITLKDGIVINND